MELHALYANGLSDKIHTTRTYVTTEVWAASASEKIADLPEHVMRFTERFDYGDYAYLQTPVA